jgi:ankyrin repeat protein
VNQKENTMSDPIREFVGASHGDMETVKRLLAEDPSLLNVVYEWMPGNTETPLQAASHVGNRAMAEFLLSQGAPLTVITAAMMGDEANFNRLLAEDPEGIHEKGGHGISLLFHAAIGGNPAITERVFAATNGADGEAALVGAISFGEPAIAKWLIEQGASPNGSDWRGRTTLEIAVEEDYEELIGLIQQKIGEANLEACPHCGAKGYKYLARTEGNPMGDNKKHFACKKCGEELEVR